MGHIVISMDSHTELVVDVKPYLPAAFHEEFDEGAAISLETFSKGLDAVAPLLCDEDVLQDSGGSGFAERQKRQDARRFVPESYTPAVDPGDRLKATDADGVAAEFITPFTGAFSPTMNPEFLHALTQGYHRYYQDYSSVAPWRFNGSTIVNFAGGMGMVLHEVAEAYDIGLRAVSLAGNVATVAPDQPAYNSAYYDPLWGAMSERGMAAIFHSGYGREKPILRWHGADRGWQVLQSLETSRGHHAALPYLLAAGVPERFPGMTIGYLESGTSWIATILQELDAYVKAQPEAGLDLLPSEQWARQCFAAGTLTNEDVKRRGVLGVENLAWGSDYPHVESTWPHSPDELAKSFAGVPDQEVFAMVAGNAARIIGYDLDRLSTTPAAQVQWPGETVATGGPSSGA